MRVVLDTNVIISALMNPEGPPGKILDVGIDGKISLLSSSHLIEELEHSLAYPHVYKRIAESLTEKELQQFLLLLRRTTTVIVHDPPRTQWVPNDPDDDWVIACAIAGKADYIVSGDQHLLALGSADLIRILPPTEFLKILERT